SPLVDVVPYAGRITRPGLSVMDTPGLDVESVTGMVAGGAQVVVFTTGLGTPTGNPIAPVIKITGNAPTAQQMSDNVDLDGSGGRGGGRAGRRRDRGGVGEGDRRRRAGSPRVRDPPPQSHHLSAGDESMSSPPRTGYVRWLICALLFFAATINYVDRQVIGI